MGRGGIDLTVRGNSRSRMVTDRTLDREGFYIPTPPQRCDRRIKSAVGIGRREHAKPKFDHNHVHSPMNRPKSACLQEANAASHLDERENESDFNNNFVSVNQKWVYTGERPKWKPRNSHTAGGHPTNAGSSIKQRISVCEVMAKMRSESAEDDNYDGSAAPPSSPKSSESRTVLGQRFVDDQASPARPAGLAPKSKTTYTNRPNYMKYAKSKTRSQKRSSNVAYLQEDMSVRRQAGQPPADVIHIPTMDMFTTDEPDEESAVIVDKPAQVRKRQAPPAAAQAHSYSVPRPKTAAANHASRPAQPNRTRSRPKTASELYKSVYVSDYQYREPQPKSMLDRPKCNYNVRYTPDTYRFQDHRYTSNSPSHEWEKKQHRPPMGNSRGVSTRRPPHSMYVGVS